MSFDHEAKYHKTAVRGSVEASDSFPCIEVGIAREENSEKHVFDTI